MQGVLRRIPKAPNPLPQPSDQSDHRGKKQNLQKGKSGWAIFGTQNFGPQTPPPSQTPAQKTPCSCGDGRGLRRPKQPTSSVIMATGGRAPAGPAVTVQRHARGGRNLQMKPRERHRKRNGFGCTGHREPSRQGSRAGQWGNGQGTRKDLTRRDARASAHVTDVCQRWGTNAQGRCCLYLLMFARSRLLRIPKFICVGQRNTAHHRDPARMARRRARPPIIDHAVWLVLVGQQSCSVCSLSRRI